MPDNYHYLFVEILHEIMENVLDFGFSFGDDVGVMAVS